jgi:cyclophilin family peptidyl-prolyl cis-trans isomerase
VPTQSPFDAGEAFDHAIGPDDAYVTILAYCDYTTPACADLWETLGALVERFAGEGDARAVWRHFPQVQTNDNSSLAIQAAEAAAAQGMFWPMHEVLLERQTEWIEQPPETFRETLSTYAGALGLDVAAFDADFDGAASERVREMYTTAAGFGLLGEALPVLGFNGVRYDDELTLWALDAMARATLLGQRHYPHAPTVVIVPGAEYRATLVTEKGDIVIDLFLEDAPVAVNNFVYLSRDGWFDDNTFFHVIDGVMAIAGDPTGTGLGGPGYTIPDEAYNGLTFTEAGMVAMLRHRDRLNSAGSQFFITMAPMSTDYDGVYTIFGRVVAGMDVIESLTPRDPIEDPLAPPGDRIEYIIIEETLPADDGE